MEISKVSKKLTSILMPDFSKFLKKKSYKYQKDMDALLKPLYESVLTADHIIAQSWDTPVIKVNYQSKRHLKNIQHCSLLTSEFVPSLIQNYIQTHIQGVLTYSATIGRRKYTIHFYLMNKKQVQNINNLDKLAFKMFVWLKFASSYSSQKCNKTLNIHCYLTPFKKLIPSNSLEILGPNCANTAVSYVCTQKGEICLFREEELFKVFIHETFHSFGLDFSTMSTNSLNHKLSNLFPIESEFNLFESYTEFWATILNVVFTSFYSLEDKSKIENFYILCSFALDYEQFFSLLQCAKVLHYMGMDYSNLFSNNLPSKHMRKYLYKENTNIFAYYVIKMMLIFYVRDFMLWCQKNNRNLLSFNKTNATLNSFLKFIKTKYKTHQLLVELDKICGLLKFLNRNIADKDNKFIMNTMRMSIIEMPH